MNNTDKNLDKINHYSLSFYILENARTCTTKIKLEDIKPI